MGRLTRILRKLILFLVLCLTFHIAKGQLKADFSMSASSGCSPLTVNFTDKSTGSPVSYLWKFGNGNQSVLKNPGASYIKAGSYTVTLIVKDGTGKTDSLVKTNAITVFASPTADFKSDRTVGCPPFNVQFTDLSTVGSGAITSYAWDFGDGGSSTLKNPSHLYTKRGVFDVKLIVKDANGCNSSIVKRGMIILPNPPTVSFKASDSANCKPPLAVNFTSSVSNAFGQVSYLWNFGDGTTSTLPNPSKNYTSLGFYTVTLTVTDSTGCSYTTTRTDLIQLQRTKAQFTANFPSFCAPAKGTFQNLSSPVINGSTYSWDFGDGTTSSDVSPSHTFSSKGSYRVKLVVTDPGGCVDSTSSSYNILDTIANVTFKADTVLCNAPYVSTLINTTPNATVVRWETSDGQSSTLASPKFTFKDTGAYTVKLIVKNAAGCTSTLVKKAYIRVYGLSPRFSMTPKQGCKPLSVTFSNTTSSGLPVTNWYWDFGNGQTSTSKDPGSIIYSDTGRFKVKLSVINSAGCGAEITQIVKVGVPPKPSFTAFPDSGCISAMHVKFLNLTNTGQIKADSFFWDFGDGMTSNDVNPTHHYRVKHGKYTVKLFAAKNGCVDSMVRVKYITVMPPWAHFDQKQDVCHPDTVHFFDQSDMATSRTWYFGDGKTDTSLNPVHVYAPGSYTVRLVVFNSTTGCTDTMTNAVDVPDMDAYIGVDKTQGCNPLKVQFNARSRPGASAWYWDFGDGDTSTSANPLHTYTKPGSYDVSLKITFPGGCTSSKTMAGLILVTGPEVSFNVSPDTGCVPFTVRLVSHTKSTVNTPTRQWVLGNGKVLNYTSDTMYYTFTEPPANQTQGFSVSYVVKDMLGCTVINTRTVYPSKLKAGFTTTKTQYCLSTKYQFDPIVNDSSGIAPLDFHWEFGDGDFSDQPNPSHTYNTEGSYKVRLVMKDAAGCVDTTAQTLNILFSHPKAAFGASPLDTTCPPLIVSFTDSSKANLNIVKWEWDFGDGTTSTLQNPKKIYLEPGRFTVKLKITDEIGCSDSIIRPTLIVIHGPIGKYSFDKDEGCVPTLIHFTSSSKQASRFSWDLGDGTIIDGQNVTHTYKYPGRYIPLLILSDSFGCTYTLPPIDTIYIHSLPKPDFTYSGFCRKTPMSFIDRSDAIDGTIQQWLWDFGDSTTSTSQNPTHTYLTGGYKTVTLTVTTNFGCRQTTSQTVRIGQLAAAFTTMQPNGCVGHPMYFTNKSISDTTLVSQLWYFGDGDSSDKANPIHTYNRKGFYDIRLVVRDLAGCSDTVFHQRFLVGDTVPPPAPVLYRVTVADDYTVEADFSRYQDIDFAKYIIYRKDAAGQWKAVDSTKDINDTIYFSKGLNTLHNVYCFQVRVQNACGFISPLSGPDCTMDLTASPGINKAVLNWTPYLGWSKVKEYQVFREAFWQKGLYFPIGVVPGNVTTYTDTSIVCYQTHVYKIKAVEDSGYRQISWSDTSATTPIYIPHVPPTEVIRATVEQNSFVRVEWKDIPSIKLKKFILEKSQDGRNFSMVDTPYNRNILFINDRNVNVNENSYTYRLQVMDSCGDLSPYSNIGKSILLHADTAADLKPYLYWSRYRFWPEGVHHYDVELKQADGKFHKVGQTNGSDSTFLDKFTDLNSLPRYCYRVIAYRAGTPANPDINLGIISMSNEACVPIRSTIWVPNVFTPNGDGMNDFFDIKTLYIKEFNIKIFDRWGTMVFESNQLSHSWDGRYKGGAPLMDAYKYLIVAKGADGNYRYLSGWVTILM